MGLTQYARKRNFARTSEPKGGKPLPKRVRTVGIPGVQAPFHPPIVLDMTPASGPAGTTVTFTGEHLAGWRATVSIGKQLLLNKQDLTGDTFTAVMPAAIGPGFQPLIQSLARNLGRFA